MADLNQKRKIACQQSGCTISIEAGILDAVDAGWLVHEDPDGTIRGDCPMHAGPGGKKLAAAINDHYNRN